MHQPLDGIRVLDLSNVLAGPFCSHQLVHMGAEVIKVERPGSGDLARQLGADPALNARHMGVSFLAQNAGKKSLTLDLKHPEGKALFLRLLDSADVLLENFRPGVMQRLGLDYEALKARKPSLVYCSISGFGQDGPWVQRPAYDQIVQGLAGVMSITGDADSAPLRAGYPVADTMGGMTAAFAIAASLNAQPRGCYLDVSMLESVLASMAWVVSNHLNAGVEPAAQGNENITSAPSGTFHAADGLINIAANKDEQWQRLSTHLGLGALQQRPEYRDRESRKTHRIALKAELEAVLRTRPVRDWAEELNALGVPAGAVLSVPEVLAEPQIAERGLVQQYPDAPGVDRDIHVLSTAYKINGHALKAATPPPQLSEHNNALWAELGLDPQDIERLQSQGIV